MLDPILRLSVSRQQGSYYVHAIGLAVPTIRGAVVNDGADLEFWGISVPTRDHRWLRILAVRKSVIIVTLDGLKIVLSMGREYPPLPK